MTEKWEIGNIDNSPIGQATPAAGAFTTLAASGNVTPDTLTASKPVFTDASKHLVSTGTLGVDQGGTGITTLTDHGVLVGSGVGAVTPLAVGTNGQVLVGSTGADPVFATITDGEGITTTLGAGTLQIDCEDASDTNKGVVELATDAEAVTGSDTDRACTPANLTARLAAPGAIGGTTPAAGAFTTLGAAGLSTLSSMTAKKTNVDDDNYNPSALTTDHIIAFIALTAAKNCIISTEDEDSGTATQPRVMIIKDESGDAGTYNITISLESGGTIDGAATYTLNQAYESVRLYINGTNAFTM